MSKPSTSVNPTKCWVSYLAGRHISSCSTHADLSVSNDVLALPAAQMLDMHKGFSTCVQGAVKPSKSHVQALQRSFAFADRQ